MEKETKEKAKIAAAVGGGAGLIGFFQGAGIDHIIAERVGAALTTGDVKGFLAYAGIFLLIWVQVKGLRKEFKALRLAVSDPDGAVSKNFAKGEIRMNAIEEKHATDQALNEKIHLDHEHRITVLEEFNKSQGGNYGQGALLT